MSEIAAPHAADLQSSEPQSFEPQIAEAQNPEHPAAEPKAADPAQKPKRTRETRRAARRRKAARELAIVGLLNSGVSIAEIATRHRLTERRMRQIVQDILDRRAPSAPAEYAALQVSRLNEALIVAYAAMGNGNLQAVQTVVKIVRELDRYHGYASPELRELLKALPMRAENPLALAARDPNGVTSH